MKQDIENIIKKNLPEKKEENKALSDGTNQEIEFLFRNCDIGVIAQHYRNVGFNQALSKINTSLIADEVLKVVVETTINMLRDESMLAECITKTLGYGHHYSTIPVLRGIVSEIEKKLLLDNNKK
jgi:hypothetical protein